MKQKVAFIFPGQGAQFPGMGKTFFESETIARETLEQAEDLLKRPLKRLILEGPEDLLTKTANSQVAIFVVSLAILRVIETHFPAIVPTFAAGLSLGEYTAAVCAGVISYENALQLVQLRGSLMEEACEKYPGTMAVVMGLSAEEVENMVMEMKLPHELWAANFNCPGQVVLSGTHSGIEAGTEEAKRRGAKRVLSLNVHGAFHSGLMREAEERLGQVVEATTMQSPLLGFVMNVPGDLVDQVKQIRLNLKKQVTSPVRWEQGIRQMETQGVDYYFEIGPGTALSGMNRKIGIKGSTLNFQLCDDLKLLESLG